MRREEIDKGLEDVSFEYFYWFSRFEFALKENGYLKSTKQGEKAEPNWESFRKKHSANYSASKEASRLIHLHPKRQIVSQSGGLDWKPVGISHCNDDLCKVITMLATVRNNLFHGGKHGDTEVDNKDRNIELLNLSKQVLDQLAKTAGFDSDYERCY